MIVRDEEAALPRCLASVASVADELVVVDTGSTDATREVARAHGARVLEFDFTRVDFAAARNHGLDHATGSHVLVLDADEALAPGSVDEVRAAVADRRADAAVVNRRNLLDGAVRRVDHAVRLFPNRPEYRYRHRVHETVDEAILEAGGRLRRSGIVIDHHLPPEADELAKSRRYLDLLEEEPTDDPDRLGFLAAEYHKLQRFAEATRVAERIAELCPDDFGAQFNAALYHVAYAHQPDRAREELARALRLRPHDEEALALWRRLG
jgi:glycosyltransferase involved in cell wall biosynthesis